MRPPRLRGLAGLFALLLLGSPGGAGSRDRGADGNFEERRSSHFVLLQDVAIDDYTGVFGSRRFERDILRVLEDAHAQVRKVLGAEPPRDVRVVIYDSAVFEREYGGLFRFSAAGFYDGAIHVRAGTAVTERLARTLHHEYAHAVIDSLAPRGTFPGWLNEGIAEYFEHRVAGRSQMSSHQLRLLRSAIADGRWIPLRRLSRPSFVRMKPEAAALAYAESFAAVEFLGRRRGEHALERLCEQLVRTGDIDRSLERVYRLTLAELEQELEDELG